jgi:predicted nucleic acid-binding protein
MTIADGRSFIDTNILVYAASPAVPQHQACRALLQSEARLCLSPQVLAEFYSVVTNPKRVTAPFTPAEAGVFIRELMPRIHILPMLAEIVARWTDLAERDGVIGARHIRRTTSRDDAGNTVLNWSAVVVIWATRLRTLFCAKPHFSVVLSESI